MMSLKTALLEDRGVVRVAGADAARLLQGLITSDLGRLSHQPAILAGLLTPQGKILFDFFVVKAGDGFLLDVARQSSAGLASRLGFYKLRASVTIADVSGAHLVAAIWGGGPPPEPPAHSGAVCYADPRRAELGWREIVPLASEGARATLAETASTLDYHAHRIAVGVPEGGRDYTLGDTFPHEALFDRLGGVDFDKGCYVGQEVVSRMEHRSTARKRVVPLVGEAALTSGVPVLAGDVVIGMVGSVASSRGLALLRLDRAGEAMARGETLTAGGVPVRIELMAWSRLAIPGLEEVKGA